MTLVITLFLALLGLCLFATALLPAAYCGIQRGDENSLQYQAFNNRFLISSPKPLTEQSQFTKPCISLGCSGHPKTRYSMLS
jgi:hypothetical protein